MCYVLFVDTYMSINSKRMINALRTRLGYLCEEGEAPGSVPLTPGTRC